MRPEFNDERLIEELWSYHMVLLEMGFRGDDLFIGTVIDPSINKRVQGVILMEDGKPIFSICVWPRQGGEKYFNAMWAKFVDWTKAMSLQDPRLQSILHKSIAVANMHNLAAKMREKGIKIPTELKLQVRTQGDPWSLRQQASDKRDTATVHGNEKKPAMYPCGCSHLKVEMGRCDVYGPDGQERARA
jgi:hypothetical protein